MPQDDSYIAFISYRRLPRDRRIARALHRGLETYSVPRPLVELGAPRRLGRVFRDREELSASPDLGAAIREALERSRFLIVVCSTETPQSEWVEKEVVEFIEMGRRDRILLLLVEGDPEHSFPRPLRDADIEPIAADVRAQSTRESLRQLRDEKLRLIATMLDCAYDSLKQRERERTIRRYAWLSAGLLVATLVFAAIAGYAIYERNEAQRRRMISLEQTLATQAVRERTISGDDERAALLARQAWLFARRHRGARLDQIDGALRQILVAPHFAAELLGGEPGNERVVFDRAGRRLAAAGGDRKIRVWNLEKRHEPPTAFASPARVRALSLDSERGYLIAVTRDDQVVAWRLAEPERLAWARPESGLPPEITATAFSPDGATLATGHPDGSLRLWSLDDPPPEPTRICCHGESVEVTAVAFHPNRGPIATGGKDGTVELWSLAGTAVSQRPLGRHETPVASLEWSPKGRRIASGSKRLPHVGDLRALAEMSGPIEGALRGGEVRIWSVGDAAPIPLEAGQGDVSSLAFSTDGHLLVTSDSGSGSVRLWDWRASPPTAIVLSGFAEGTTALALEPRAAWLAAVGRTERGVRLWRLALPLGAPVELHGQEDRTNALAFDEAGTQLAAAGGADARVRIWDPEAPEARPRTLPEHDASSLAVAFGPGSFLASGSGGAIPDPDNSVRIYRLDDPEASPSLLEGHASRVLAVAFAPDGSLLASAGELDGEILLWNPREPDARPRPLSTAGEHALALAFHPDGSGLAWGGTGGTIRLQDLATDRFVPFEGPSGAVTTVAFDASEKRLAAAGDDSRVRVWQIDAPETPLRDLPGHDGQPVHAVAWGGGLLASGGADGTIRLWDPDAESVHPRIVKTPWDQVYALAFRPTDGRWLAAGGDDATIRMWPSTDLLADRVCEAVWRNLSSQEWSELVADDLDYECTCPELRPGAKTGLTSCPQGQGSG